MSVFYSLLYTIVIGGLFVCVFIFLYDFFYGEKPEKQIKKLHKYFGSENIKKIEPLRREPKKFTLFAVKTNNGVQKMKVKPGYKIVKIVSEKKNHDKENKRNAFRLRQK